jgi:hypothetical protein
MWYWLILIVFVIGGLFLYTNVKKVTKCSSCPNQKNYDNNI